MKGSTANLRTARLHSRRNPEAWCTRLTARPKVNTPLNVYKLFMNVIYLFLSLFNDLCYLVIQGLIVTARLRSRRNPEVRYTRLTVQPKVSTPSLFISYSLVIYLFLGYTYIVYKLLGVAAKVS